MQFEQTGVFGHLEECQVSHLLCVLYFIDKRHSPCIRATTEFGDLGKGDFTLKIVLALQYRAIILKIWNIRFFYIERDKHL